MMKTIIGGIKMKCQKCGKESKDITAACPFCNENYSLASVLQWVVDEYGKDILDDSRQLKSNILDLCRDKKYDSVILEGLLNQGFAKKVKTIYESSDFEGSLETYCKTLSSTYNIDKINYIADAFYFALTGKNRIHKNQPMNPVSQSTTVNATKTSPAVNKNSTNVVNATGANVQSSISEIINKVQGFDFKSFFSNLNFQSIKAFVQKNKKISYGVVGVIAFIIVVSVISSVVGNINDNKKNDITDSDSSYESSYDENNEDVFSPNYDYLSEDTVTDVVYQDSAKEYYIKTENSGVYRFSANDRTANYNVYISVYNLNDERVFRETNEGSCTLDSNGTYKIVVETDSQSCSYTFKIDRPNEIKTFSQETNTLHDSLTYIDQCNVYTFSAPVSGRYRVDCLNRTDGYNIELEIYNSNNDRVFRETNGGYLDMEKGVVYSIRAAYSTGACEYDIKISIPSATKEISGEETTVPDKFAFANQINTYTYIAPVSGKYRFETSDRTNGYNVQLRIYDANNNRIVGETNNGTVDMEKDVKYRIEIEYDTELCSYNLVIGVPNEVKTISAGKAISDSIKYVNQENRYTFTPGSSGDYVVKASNRTNEYNVEIYMFDANNNRVLRENNEGTVSLTAGTLYTIYVCYIDNLCDYSIKISK